MKRIFLTALTSLIVLSFGVPRVLAQQGLTEYPDDAPVVQRCLLAQNYLKNIQKPRDLRARVDRLQAYRYIYQRMNVFVLRLERNDQPEASNLRASLDRLNQSIDEFKTDYETYDSSRELVVKQKNCSDDYSTFSTNIANMREDRAQVNRTVELIESILNPNIATQLDTLYQQLLISGRSGAVNE